MMARGVATAAAVSPFKRAAAAAKKKKKAAAGSGRASRARKRQRAEVAGAAAEELYGKLAAAAVADGLVADAGPLLALLEIKVGPNGERNSGNAMFKAFTLAVKYHRQRAVHVTPTCAVNGIICDTSSGWTVLEWRHFLSGVLPAAPAN